MLGHLGKQAQLECLRLEPFWERLDHHYLNEVPGMENPTSEVLAGWLLGRLVGPLPLLRAVTVAETCDSRCTVRRG